MTNLAETFVRVDLEASPWAHSFLSDYSGLGRYQAVNRSLPPITMGRIVFYGDSITDFWPTYYPNQFFLGKPYIGRGISGQSTPGMVWRFRQDVIELHPSAVVILAGTNDVVLPEGHVSYQETIRNIQTMAGLAQRYRIRVILCSLLPVSRYPEPKQADFTREIRNLNLWLRTYAMKQHLTYVDYYGAMASQSGAMLDTLSADGLHPNAAGYAVMGSLAQQAIDRAD